MKRILLILILLGTCIYGTTQNKPAIEWIYIPSGTFYMGSPPDEEGKYTGELLHQVTLKSFKMSKYEITVRDFKAFVDATGYITDAEKGAGKDNGSAKHAGKFKYKTGVNWRCDANGKLRPESDYNHPVVHISWYDAKEFATWMDCRLPTDAEWEYACRAGTTTPFNTGYCLSTDLANFNPNFPYIYKYCKQGSGLPFFTMPVGSFPANPWGLYDMHGNVQEWCNDWYDEFYSLKFNTEYEDQNNIIAPQTNPEGPSQGYYKVRRGGGWSCYIGSCRSANRMPREPQYRCGEIGFRIVSDE